MLIWRLARHIDIFSVIVQLFFSFILLIHEGSHREAYQEFQPSYDIFRRFRAPPAYTAQLLTLHQHRANNQYRTANQI